MQIRIFPLKMARTIRTCEITLEGVLLLLFFIKLVGCRVYGRLSHEGPRPGWDALHGGLSKGS